MNGMGDVLAAHANCALNTGQDLGSAATGVDIWSCGITLPFCDDLEQAERAHVEAALVAAGFGDVGQAARDALLGAAYEWQYHLRRDAALYDYGRWLNAAATMLRARAAAVPVTGEEGL